MKMELKSLMLQKDFETELLRNALWELMTGVIPPEMEDDKLEPIIYNAIGDYLNNNTSLVQEVYCALTDGGYDTAQTNEIVDILFSQLPPEYRE
jgi:hypothetical protein